ncbi:unnamed protein product [Hymenolepis diminuta]|uniref:Uncharacterized protein n=1 Tax=Hymenolepis diminuta TaxID=6216 RepID=A0A564XYC1_HYMDI|nr:unnamed protein product [Hymenolepis diminuta]VUZ41837.1 unnamed protein product [Hymenolepis diminuta]VUZ41840.1 unnamed protein product [Hymenolepis diminuta]VUZ53012.1 unnamed protein product [Hymenolepis diminuta]
MPDSTVTNEMKTHAVTVFIMAKHRNLEIARVLQDARSLVCKVRNDLLNGNNGDELATTRKR